MGIAIPSHRISSTKFKILRHEPRGVRRDQCRGKQFGHLSRIEDLGGLASRSPGLALVLLISLLSLAGIPPLSGFVGKFFLFASAFREGHHWLVLAAILNSVTSLYYYLGVLRIVYFATPASQEPLTVPAPQRMAILLSSLGVVLLGMFSPLAQWAYSVAGMLVR